MLNPITDRRVARDPMSLAGRSPIPFGSGYRSGVHSIADRETATTGYGAFLATFLGKSVVYGDPALADATAFPDGATRVLQVGVGRVGIDGGVVGVEAGTTTVVASQLGGVAPNLRTTKAGSVNLRWGNAPSLAKSVNIEVGQGGCCCRPGPWITTGVPGLSLQSVGYSDFPPVLKAGEVAIGGEGGLYGVAVDSGKPTVVAVALRLWANDAIDLDSCFAAEQFCQAQGFFYNGDVDPDRLEAWLVQASAMSGLSPVRDRNGLGFAILGTPAIGPDTLLLSARNAREVRYRWSALDDLHTGERWVKDMGCGLPPMVMAEVGAEPFSVEEALGVLTTEESRVAKAAALWRAERASTCELTATLTVPAKVALALRIGSTVALGSAGASQGRSQSGYLAATTAQGATPSWNGVLVDGHSDTASASAITDTSKRFDLIVKPGDTVLITAQGQSWAVAVASVAATALTLASGSSWPGGDCSYVVLATAPGQTLYWQESGSPIGSAPAGVTVVGGKLQYSGIPPLPIGTPICVGALKAFRITKMDGPRITAVGA
jgi:hypothetical protein